MSIPGSKILSKVYEERKQIEKRAVASASFVEKQESRLLDLVSKRKQEYLSLAARFLPTLEDVHIERVFSHIEDRFTAVLKTREELQDKSDPLFSKLNIERGELQELIVKLLDEMAGIEQELEQKLEAYEKALHSSAQHKNLAEEQQKAEESLSKFDTENLGFFKKLFVGRKIKRLQHKFESAKAEILAIEQQTAEEVGLTPVYEKLERKKNALNSVFQGLFELTKAVDDLRETVVDLHAPSSEYYGRLQEVFGDFMQAQGLGTIRSMAEEIEGPEAVAQAAAIDSDISEAVDKIDQMERERTAHNEALERIDTFINDLNLEAKYELEHELEELIKDIVYRSLPAEDAFASLEEVKPELKLPKFLK